ncbi:MAG: hypothetical protein R3F37_00030 [Candidatus Competibacteraceae bacterium]
MTSTVLNALATNVISISLLSRALDLQDYHHAVSWPRERGSAAGAYRAMLHGNNLNVPSRRHIWILRYPPVREVCNLLQAKRYLLTTLDHLFQDNVGQFTRYLRGHSGSNLFWAFVILHNTQHHPPIERLEPERNRERYQGPSVAFESLCRAGLYALHMRPQPVLAFLLQQLSEQGPSTLKNHWVVPTQWTSHWERLPQ